LVNILLFEALVSPSPSLDELAHPT
jgi:hypothetical protein